MGDPLLCGLADLRAHVALHCAYEYKLSYCLALRSSFHDLSFGYHCRIAAQRRAPKTEGAQRSRLKRDTIKASSYLLLIFLSVAFGLWLQDFFGPYSAVFAEASGSAILKGQVAPAGFNVVVRFFIVNTDTEVMKSANSTDAEGYFWIYGVPAGTYDVGVKTDNAVSILSEDQVFVTEQITEIDFGTFSRGDLDGDDDCDHIDFGIFADTYPAYGDCLGYSGNWTAPETTASSSQGEDRFTIGMYYGVGAGCIVGIAVLGFLYLAPGEDEHGDREENRL